MIRRIAGIALLAAALVVGGIALLALLDPAVAQLANDADPFGAPPPWYVAAVLLAGAAGVAALGWRLARGRGRLPSRPAI